jgi:5-formyltetrahydrofolate cyclo-ligase
MAREARAAAIGLTPTRRHHAGPGPSRKQALRARVWSLLERRGVGRFPMPLAGRIPNFSGAEQAAERLAALPEWKTARRLKCNPDAPQRPVRLRALRDGKIVFMAVPRLATEACFIRLDPARLRGKLAAAATIKGASAFGARVGPEALGRIHLVVAGSVAVDRRGGRLGKGGGYSDLEFALARQLGAVGEKTPVVTTVHPLQIVEGTVPMTPHDVPLDLVVTPRVVLRVRRTRRKPSGIRWGELSRAQLEAMPLLVDSTVADLLARGRSVAGTARRAYNRHHPWGRSRHPERSA